MPTSDTDLLLINDGSKTETITIAEVRDASMLNDTDLFLVNDGTKTETITWLDLSSELGPQGTVDKPTVLKPEDGAGSGATLYLKSDAITSVDSGGVTSTETSTITNVTDVPISSTLGLRTAWSGYGGPAWLSTDSWSLLSLSTNFGGDSGTKGYSQEAIVTSPYTFSSADFGAGIRGANGWALWFPAVVTIQLDFSIGYTGVFVTTCQSDTQTVGEGVRTGFTGAIMNLTGKVFYMDATSVPSFPFKSVSWYGANSVLELTDDTNLDKFNDGDEVQNSGRVVSKDATSTPPTITVGGGDWYGSDGSGTPGGETKVAKSTVYDTTLTVAGPTDLDDVSFTGQCFMSDGTPVDGPYTQAPYKLVTSKITNVAGQLLTTSGTAIDVGAVESLYDPGKANPYAGVNDSLRVGINYGGAFRVNFSTPISGNVIVWANWAAGSAGMSLSGDGGAATVPGVAQDSLLAPYDMGTVSGMTYVEIAGTSTTTIWGIVVNGSNIDGDGVLLTFNDPCPDLKYFKAGDLIGNGVYPSIEARTGNNSASYNSCTPETIAFNTNQTTSLSRIVYLKRSDFSKGSITVKWKSGDKLYIQGTNDPTNPPGGNTLFNSYGDFTFGPSTPFEYIRIYAGGSASGCTWTLVNSPVSVVGVNEAERKMTVNGGSYDPAGIAGDDEIEYQTNGGQGDIVGVDLANNKVFIQETGDRDNRWIADNQAGTDFFIAGPNVVDSPLLTTDVELQSSPFATTPVGVDGLQGIVWNLNGIDQPMTLLNPYKPTGLTTNTTYNVKVKHVANVIGESEWSETTTFTTGVSRSLVEHYTTQITALQVALAEATGDP